VGSKDFEFICTQCQHKAIKWEGRCSHCNEWNTFVDLADYGETKNSSSHKISDLIGTSLEQKMVHDLDWSELERVLGGGLVAGGMTLLAGEPGVGKSTLIIKLLKSLNVDKPALYVSGEEGINQIASRAKRLNLKDGNIRFLSTADINIVIEEVSIIKPSLVIIDSIQTLMNPEVMTPAGSVSQVKEVTQLLISKLKEKNITCLIIGHISKDGSIAGPKVLEHMVDVVLYFEKLKGHQQRSLICKKNRFGTTEEKGIFEMTANGLEDYTLEKSLLKLKSKAEGSGYIYTVVEAGSRPLLFEIQVLVVKANQTFGKRVVKGIEANRAAIIVALLEKELKVSLNHFDIYIDIVGESKIPPDDIDLPLGAAIYSALLDKPLISSFILTGKLTLNGRVVQAEEKKPNSTFEYYKIERLSSLKELFKDKAS